MIFGERIEQARELHGWTQTELARRVGVDQSTIAYIEGGRKRPSDAVADAIAFQTGFPPSFFRQEPCPYFPFGSLEFRARASMTGRERRQAYQYAKTVFEVAARMAARLKTPPVRLSRLKCSPPEAARITRSELGLSPDTPIRHLVHELERAGVVVLALPVRLEGRDGFSGWAGGEHPVPVINLPAGAPGDRLRFSVGHEV